MVDRNASRSNGTSGTVRTPRSASRQSTTAPTRSSSRGGGASRLTKLRAQQQAVKQKDAIEGTKKLFEGGYFDDVKTVADYKAKYDAAPAASKPLLLSPQSVESDQQAKLAGLYTQIDSSLSTNTKLSSMY